jgi:putative transposase
LLLTKRTAVAIFTIMPRRIRVASGGYAYHIMNRSVGRARIFRKDRDYEAFEKVLIQAKKRLPMRILGWCVMPNHWHLVLWPQGDGDLSEFMRWLTVTHTQRWHAAHDTSGTGPLYQGRFKSFPIQEDDHLLMVIRYVERNALRANLVERAGQWRWSSLWCREHGDPIAVLDEGPIILPRDWLQHVQLPETEAELAALRQSVVRGLPFGHELWQQRTAKRLGLQSTLRPRGRPAKRPQPRRPI